MAIKMTQKEILAKFPKQTLCVVSYMNQKDRVKQPLSRIKWKDRPQAITILFGKPRFYIVDGDEAIREGFRIEVVGEKKK